MTTAASLRKMCQPKFKVEDGKRVHFIINLYLRLFIILICISDIVNAIQRGEFAEVKELKVIH